MTRVYTCVADSLRERIKFVTPLIVLACSVSSSFCSLTISTFQEQLRDTLIVPQKCNINLYS